MARIYSYSFDYSSITFTPSTVSAKGSFQVDYDTLQFSNINIAADGLMLTSGRIVENSPSSHYLSFVYSSGTVTTPTAPSLADQASLRFQYGSADTSSFSNVSYLRIIASSTFPSRLVLVMAQASNAPVTTAAVCFTTGTRLLTEDGEVAVEDLRVGDRAVTASGALRPVAWIGHRPLSGEVTMATRS